MCRFLRFTVEAAIQGRGDQLKEYLVGLEVFDKNAAFDPRVDPIVRVEARRFRSKLKNYYEADGAEDNIVIEYQTGSYTPRFRNRSEFAGGVGDATRPSNHIVVLPFSNLGGGDNEYFSDGLTEELIHVLARSRHLRVIAWNTAQQLKGSDLREIGRKLRAGSLLQGSVRRSGNRLRITVQLVDVSTGEYRWSEAYNRQVQDIIAIQEEISRSIARVLESTFSHAEQPGAAPKRMNPIAYSHYLRGRFYWNQRTEAGLRRAVECFQQACQADPECALAYVGLADAYTLFADYGLESPRDVIPKARAAAMKALELDASLGEANAALGLMASIYDWQWEKAGEYYQRSIELNPGYATARHWFGTDYLALLGRFDEALEQVRLARQLDPLARSIHESEGYVLMLARRYDEAIEVLHDLLDQDPDYPNAYGTLGRALALSGDLDEGICMLERRREMSPELASVLGALGQCYGMRGDAAKARAVLADLERLAARKTVQASCFALVNLGLGNKQEALRWLEAGCERHEAQVTKIKVHPVWDELRGEPAFKTLLDRVRFPK
jgi:serine/threonine-protein kinase